MFENPTSGAPRDSFTAKVGYSATTPFEEKTYRVGASESKASTTSRARCVSISIRFRFRDALFNGYRSCKGRTLQPESSTSSSVHGCEPTLAYFANANVECPEPLCLMLWGSC
jgi:hypothetical protein